MLTNCDILCISDICWDEHWSVEQQFMSRLSQCNRVLYIERPVSILTPFKRFGFRHAIRQVSHWIRGGVRKKSENLYVASPPPVLPLRYLDVINAINGCIYGRWIERLSYKLGFTSPILWVFEPSAARVISRIKHSLLIYHCLDSWTGSSTWWNSNSAIEKQERRLINMSKIVFAVSRSLTEEKSKYNQNTFYIPNGADFFHFSKAQSPQLRIPQETESLSPPVIGFIGVIGSRFDAKLMTYVADQRKGWSFLFVGPVVERVEGIRSLMKLPNVFFVGMQPIEQLPAYLKAMDVCTIPYRSNDFTDNCFPLKIFEYISAGKPIVATVMPSLREYSDFVWCSPDSDTFLKNLDKALLCISQEAVKRRMELGKNNSWEKRIEQACRIIRNCL